MKKGLTEVIILHDNNNPVPELEGFQEQVRKSYRAFLTTLKKTEAEIPDCEIRVTLGVFGSGKKGYALVADDIPAAAVKITAKHFTHGNGFRDVIDSLGNAILEKGSAYSATDESEHPENVIFVLTMFGRDNASKNLTYSKVADMVKHQALIYNWKFLCLTNETVISKKLAIRSRNTIWLDTDMDNFFGTALGNLSERIINIIKN